MYVSSVLYCQYGFLLEIFKVQRWVSWLEIFEMDQNDVKSM